MEVLKASGSLRLESLRLGCEDVEAVGSSSSSTSSLSEPNAEAESEASSDMSVSDAAEAESSSSEAEAEAEAGWGFAVEGLEIWGVFLGVAACFVVDCLRIDFGFVDGVAIVVLLAPVPSGT